MERKGDWIQTFTGKQFWPLDPRPGDIFISDVAHALSMKCRYNGHCNEFYSVAQHSVLVAEECERRWPDRHDLAMCGLLHDLGEAYLPDVPRPIKYMGVGILVECEQMIMAAASEQLGFEWPEPKEIKIIDNAILAAEKSQLMKRNPDGCEWELPEPPADVAITPLCPIEARELFLQKFSELKVRQIRGVPAPADFVSNFPG